MKYAWFDTNILEIDRLRLLVSTAIQTLTDGLAWYLGVYGSPVV